MAMGMTPQETKKCSLWEFAFASEGFKLANPSGEEGGIRAPTEERLHERLAELGIEA